MLVIKNADLPAGILSFHYIRFIRLCQYALPYQGFPQYGNALAAPRFSMESVHSRPSARYRTQVLRRMGHTRTRSLSNRRTWVCCIAKYGAPSADIAARGRCHIRRTPQWSTRRWPKLDTCLTSLSPTSL